MNTQITTFDLGDMSTPMKGDEAAPGVFSWMETLQQPEDPFFAYSPLATFDDVKLVDAPEAEAGHKERFDTMVKAAIKPKK
jgi:hypothetical protein